MAWDPVGPMYVALGDPTTAAGAGMKQLRRVRSVQIDLNNRTAWTSSDAQGGVPFSDGMYTLAVQPSAQVGLMDADVDQIPELVLGAQSNTSGTQTSVGFPTAFALIAEADVPTAALVPSGEASEKESADHAFWMPAVALQGPTGMQFGRITEGEIDQPYQMTFNAGYRTTDQDAAAISAKWRIIFMGPPAGAPSALSWSLPTLS